VSSGVSTALYVTRSVEQIGVKWAFEDRSFGNASQLPLEDWLF